MIKHAKCVIAFAALALFANGCDSSECNSVSDCFSGEICFEKQCVVDDGSSRIDAGNNVTSDMRESDMREPDIHTPDMTHDVALPDAELDIPEDAEPDLPPMLACQVDRFESTCTDDMWEINNTWTQGKLLSDRDNRPGCNVPSRFVPMDKTIEPMLCARDLADWFHIEFTPCEQQSIRIIWTATPTQECSAELFGLDSLSYNCGTEATCTKLDEASTVIIDIPATGLRQFQVSYVEVAGMQGVQTPYTLRVQVESR